MIINFRRNLEGICFALYHSRIGIRKVLSIYESAQETNLDLHLLYGPHGIIVPAKNLKKGAKTAVKVVLAGNGLDLRSQIFFDSKFFYGSENDKVFLGHSYKVFQLSPSRILEV